MRLYVHWEPTDAALAWTKRLLLPSTCATDTYLSVHSVLGSFFAAYNVKFRPKTPLGVENVDVYVEFHQNAASRRLLPSLEVPIAAVCSSNGVKTDTPQLMRQETCDFELFVTPKQLPTQMSAFELPTALKGKKDCPIHSTEDGQHVELQRVLELAEIQMKQRKFRAARDIYTHMVLPEDPLNPEALLALGDILMICGRREEAAERFLNCWKAHGRPNWDCKTHARLAFTSALKLAECYSDMGKFLEAVNVLNELETLFRVDGNDEERNIFTDANERLEMREKRDILEAQALYGTKNPDDEKKAIALVERLLPDLQGKTLNLDALLLYAKIAHDRGKQVEGLNMTLRVLVGKPNDRAVKKTLVFMLEDAESMQRLQKVVPPTSPSAGAAYAFIATILKEYGVLGKSIACFQQAQVCDPQSASYALNHAHALEVCCQYSDAFAVLTSFFRGNRSLAVGIGKGGAAQLQAGSFVDILEQDDPWSPIDKTAIAMQGSSEDKPNWRVSWHHGHAKVVGADTYERSEEVAPLDVQSFQDNEKNPTTLSEMELDLLACFFTIVKILFVSGRISVLPLLIQVLEPLRIGRELHQTTIRNEQAYYACISQLLSIEEGLEINSSLSDHSSIYVCGDSHTLATAWRRINVHNEPILLRPALVTGLKHWHLRKESTFYPKLNFWHAVANIPCKSRVVFLFGEIDCRAGILDAVEKCKYEFIEEGMQHTIDMFMEALEDVVRKYAFDVYIHPVVPVLDETRSLVVQYNKLFQKCVTKSPICTWLDFFDDLVCERPLKLRPEFRLDGTHLHPSYLTRLEAALTSETHPPK